MDEDEEKTDRLTDRKRIIDNKNKPQPNICLQAHRVLHTSIYYIAQFLQCFNASFASVMQYRYPRNMLC